MFNQYMYMYMYCSLVPRPSYRSCATVARGRAMIRFSHVLRVNTCHVSSGVPIMLVGKNRDNIYYLW